MIINLLLEKNSYDIEISKGILKDIHKDFECRNHVLVVTDSGVPTKYLDSLIQNMNDKCFIYTIEQGEQSKNIDNLKNILQFILTNNFKRNDCIVALGGGVVGDLAAFSASIYMRGIDFYNIPTTLLSMVDSSIGGKTGIDFGGVKNSVGTFYQPKKVYIDLDVLDTLDKRLINCGLAESIKMALCLNKEYYYYLKDNITNLDYEKVVVESCKMKKVVVEKDEKESNLRKVLNFGHTIGHGIEEASNGKLLHGECVALGMLCMSDDSIKNELIEIYEKIGLPTKVTINKEKVLSLIKHDKKSIGDEIDCVVVNKAGTFEFEKKTIEEIADRFDIIST